MANQFETFMDAPQSSDPSQMAKRLRTCFAFANAGGTLGLALGLIEAGMLYHIPRFAGLARPDVRGAIWFTAPSADAPVLALAGFLLGLIAVSRRHPSPGWQAAWAAVGMGLATAYLGWLFLWFHVGLGWAVPKFFVALRPPFNLVVAPAVYFVLGALVSFALLLNVFRRAEHGVAGKPRWTLRSLACFNLAAVLLLSLAVVAIRFRPSPQYVNSWDRAPAKVRGNNVVLIILDTVRADHLSCYGYARSTSPRLDQLASRGVLFENAMAPTSWTLPSLASIQTGLLPHQHGANWQQAMSAQPATLAQILKAQGYETAAFNANPDYGLAGWGLDSGFDTYWDASDWLRHNLAATFAGQSIGQEIYRQFIGFNSFDQLNAGQVNHRVLDWFHHRSGRPFFLFINYMDAHRPYVPPAPFDHHFGRIPKPLLWNICFSLHDGQWTKPIQDADRQELMDGYDNSLLYLDAEIGRLLDELASSPDAARTVVIVAGDHGEGFGEHGAYEHGWSLYREVLHVPLIVAGPGVPAARRVANAVALRQLFPTVLQMALRDQSVAANRASLSQFWMDRAKQKDGNVSVVSEISRWTGQGREVSALSIADDHWHYLLNSDGHAELFDWAADTAENDNLEGSTDFQSVAARLRSQLESILAASLRPWQGLSYMRPLDEPNLPFFRRALLNPKNFQRLDWPVGSSQAYFSKLSPRSIPRPTPAQQDELRSLPYH